MILAYFFSFDNKRVTGLTQQLVLVGGGDGGVVLHGGERAAPGGGGGLAAHALADLGPRRAQDHVPAGLAPLQHHLRVHQLDCGGRGGL